MPFRPRFISQARLLLEIFVAVFLSTVGRAQSGLYLSLEMQRRRDVSGTTAVQIYCSMGFDVGVGNFPINFPLYFLFVPACLMGLSCVPLNGGFSGHASH